MSQLSILTLTPEKSYFAFIISNKTQPVIKIQGFNLIQGFLSAICNSLVVFILISLHSPHFRIMWVSPCESSFAFSSYDPAISIIPSGKTDRTFPIIIEGQCSLMRPVWVSGFTLKCKIIFLQTCKLCLQHCYEEPSQAFANLTRGIFTR